MPLALNLLQSVFEHCALAAGAASVGGAVKCVSQVDESAKSNVPVLAAAKGVQGRQDAGRSNREQRATERAVLVVAVAGDAVERAVHIDQGNLGASPVPHACKAV